jgi:hypothetical protein
MQYAATQYTHATLANQTQAERHRQKRGKGEQQIMKKCFYEYDVFGVGGVVCARKSKF